jgi:peptidoglycan-associated lipoprotein
MKSKLVRITGFLAMFLLETTMPQPADACGVKLTVKPTGPRKAVARSARPSRILLLGNPPRRLERDLAAAGHSVDTKNPRQDKYAIIVVDSREQQGDAQNRFANATVLVRSGDVGADVKSVEQSLARKPVATAVARAPSAAQQQREPIAAGPEESQRREVVAVKPTSEAPAETTPAPTPPAAVAKSDRPAPSETPADPPAKPRPAPVTSLDEEVFFGYNSVAVGASSATRKAVKYLTGNPSATIVVEGHADPRGNPDANLQLGRLRAEAVRDVLVANGADASRIDVESKGDTQLKYDANDGRNRRVVIRRK